NILTGKQLYHMTDDALAACVEDVSIFAETEPAQKERIVRALQKAGNTVGYLGDGINDASAIKVADVGISVSNAVDVAREAAGIVLLEKNLDVLSDGIEEGRKTYLNTLKYIFLTTSASFGNMFSMAVASFLIPFLPLLPVQVLLLNFLTDLPSFAIASDNVDAEMLAKPRKWDMKLIRNFMIVFGLESSIFDFITFSLLYFSFHAGQDLFRSGWFVESALTEVLILMIIRTRRPFVKSLPGKLLLSASLAVVAAVIVIPYTLQGNVFSFVPLPAAVIAAMIGIALLYTVTGEMTKRILFRKLHF
ncbi:MAG TPA: HAD-IC family P-type ATPase, partial [Bacteroidia bacterium]|nr:HAD-IC family P-type ATPase [Bacteroidia bacterium]